VISRSGPGSPVVPDQSCAPVLELASPTGGTIVAPDVSPGKRSIWAPGQPAKIISEESDDDDDDGEDGDCNEDCCSRILGAFRYQNDPNDDKEGTENNSERDCADEIH